jgi:hypothetical protein
MRLSLDLELANQLNSYLRGAMQLSAYREWMMQFRVQKLHSASETDKTFVYAFETRYAQFQAEAITEFQFKQLLTYAALAQPLPVANVWVYPDPNPQTTGNAPGFGGVSTGSYHSAELAVA